MFRQFDKAGNRINRKPIYSPVVHWGLLEYYDDELKFYKVQKYVFHIPYEVDGVPFDEFSKTESFPIPREYRKLHKDYAKIAMKKHVKTPEPFTHEIQEFFKKFRVEDKAMIQLGIEKGFLRSVSDVGGVAISYLLERDWHYRIIKEVQPYRIHGQCSLAKVYDTYDEALVAAKGICADHEMALNAEIELNFIEDVEYVVSRLPEKYKYYKDTLMSLQHDYGFSLRYYQGEILYKKSCSDDYIVLLKI
jgi:hypothetical protein